MTDTLRVTTSIHRRAEYSLKSNRISSRATKGTLSPVARATQAPSYVIPPSAACQERANRSRNRRTFLQILDDTKAERVSRLKDRAFRANQIAKATSGATRVSCYTIKSQAINALLRIGAATLCTLEIGTPTPAPGISFSGGGGSTRFLPVWIWQLGLWYKSNSPWSWNRRYAWESPMYKALVIDAEESHAANMMRVLENVGSRQRGVRAFKRHVSMAVKWAQRCCSAFQPACVTRISMWLSSSLEAK